MTFTNQTKNTGAFTNVTKNTGSSTNASKNVTTIAASAGQYYGFGAFTYSGNQTIINPTPWSNSTKH